MVKVNTNRWRIAAANPNTGEVMFVLEDDPQTRFSTMVSEKDLRKIKLDKTYEARFVEIQ